MDSSPFFWRMSKVKEHLQSVVLSRCSSLDLLRLATASRGIHSMAMGELSRRLVDITVDVVEDDKFRLTVHDTHVSRIFDPHTMFRDPPHGRAIAVLIRHCRVRHLNVESDYHEIFVHDIDDELRKWKGRHRVQHLTLPINIGHVSLLDHLIPTCLHLTASVDSTCPYRYEMSPNGSLPAHMFIHRGILEAEELTIDDMYVHSRQSPAVNVLPTLLCPTINLSAYSTMYTRDVIWFVEQWLESRRNVTSFTACVRLGESKGDEHVSADLASFVVEMVDAIGESSEADLPSAVPRAVIVEQQKAVEMHGASAEVPRAIQFVRANDEKKMLLLAKPLESDDLFSLAIFEL